METAQPRSSEPERHKGPPSFSVENVARAATGWQEPKEPRSLPDANLESFEKEVPAKDLEEDAPELPEGSVEFISREEAKAEEERRMKELLSKLS